MRIELRTLVERLTRWLVAQRIDDAEAAVARYREPFRAIVAQLPGLLTGTSQEAFSAQRDQLVDAGVPVELAARIAATDPASMMLGVAEVALEAGQDPAEVARVHVELGERLGLPLLLARIVALPRDDRWTSMARASLREDLHAVHAGLTARVLEGAEVPEPSALMAAGTDGEPDLARLSVAVRALRTLL
jgi:glutamate dehydrogenase